MRKMNIFRVVCAAVGCMAVASTPYATKAQGVEVSVGADVVSSYVWRGAYCGGTSVQPSLSVSTGGLSLTAWGSAGFTSPNYLDEYDLTLGYGAGGFSVAITDYWFTDHSGNSVGYFTYTPETTSHMFEGTLAYDFGPLAASINTFFAGNDFKAAAEGEEAKRAYSTYFELSAPFTLGGLDFKAELGTTFGEGLYADKFSVVNIGITGSKTIQITDNFSIPAFTKVIFNTAEGARSTFFVFGITL